LTPPINDKDFPDRAIALRVCGVGGLKNGSLFYFSMEFEVQKSFCVFISAILGETMTTIE
jgi:hypothetical protein